MGSGGRPASGGRVVRHRTDGQLKRTSRLGDGSVTRCGGYSAILRRWVAPLGVCRTIADRWRVPSSVVLRRIICRDVRGGRAGCCSACTARAGRGREHVALRREWPARVVPGGLRGAGLAGVVALAVIGFWLTLGGFAARVDMRRGTRLVLFGTFGAVLLAAGALLFLPPYHSPVSPPGRDPCAYPPNYYAEHHIDVAKLCGSGTAYAGEKTSGGGGGGDSTVALVLAAGASLLTLVVLGTAVVMALRRRRSREELAAENAPVLEALDESLEDLRRERDVRRAIVACYARMERALAGSGQGRRAHETPLEFLRRVLERVAQEPGQVLTELFERARLSVEPMGEMEKRSAIAALEQLRVEVAR